MAGRQGIVNSNELPPFFVTRAGNALHWLSEIKVMPALACFAPARDETGAVR
jgi:hypothetical protein